MFTNGHDDQYYFIYFYFPLSASLNHSHWPDVNSTTLAFRSDIQAGNECPEISGTEQTTLIYLVTHIEYRTSTRRERNWGNSEKLALKLNLGVCSLLQRWIGETVLEVKQYGGRGGGCCKFRLRSAIPPCAGRNLLLHKVMGCLWALCLGSCPNC